ncbi:MAG: hypothetical protein RLZZ502_457 [Pseudomonadota bacterium]|jgi:tripartite-type tricarboxylate transporter receptor subunit TctC
MNQQHMNKLGTRELLAFFIFLCASCSSMVWAQKPISLVVPYPAGGPLDAAARSLAAKLSLDAPVVVENKAGAGGNIGAAYVSRSLADGRTLLIGAVATHAINPHLFKDMPYDALRDFTPITLLAQVPNVLVMSAEKARQQKIQNAKDFLDAYRKSQGRWNFASGGNGSAGHLAGALLQQSTGVAVTHIPYAGAAPALQSLLAGTTDFMFDNLASASTQLKAGKIIALAVTSPERSAYLPEVPTVVELGLPKLTVHTWFGVFAPAGFKETEKWHQANLLALEQPEVKEKFAALQLYVPKYGPLEFKAFIEKEHKFYADLIKSSAIKLE